MMGYIYKMKSPSDKVYIGQTRSSKTLKNRISRYKNIKCEKQPKLFNSLIKYGYDKHNFEIIEECSIEELDGREIYWISYYDSCDNGLNCTYGGLYARHSNETKKKMSDGRKGQKRKPMSEETKVKIGLANKGRKKPIVSDETKQKMSNRHKQKWANGDYKDRKIDYDKIGLSDEAKEKMRIGASKSGKSRLGKKRGPYKKKSKE